MQTGSLIIEVFHILEKHVCVAYDKTSAEGVLGLGHGTSVWLYVFMCISRYFPVDGKELRDENALDDHMNN